MARHDVDGDYEASIRDAAMVPIWQVMRRTAPKQPTSPCVPALWKWRAVWPLLSKACERISAEDAERRVLGLENPGMPGQVRTTRSLFAGYQAILPGEEAPPHRHTQSALRVVLEGEGAYTAVEGERIPMRRGDFIITPAWAWHSHGHHGNEPMVWLDGLDIPIVELLSAQFFEKPEATPPARVAEAQAVERFGAGMVPAGMRPTGRTSPQTCYPYARSREALQRLRDGGAPQQSHGFKIEFINPLTGGPAIPTIGTYVQLLPRGFRGRKYRATDSAIYVVLEGAGSVHLADRHLDWEVNDVFAVPSWHEHELSASEDAVLFSFSDRPVQEALDLWRSSDHTS